MDKITIVVPCYNEEEALEYFYTEIKKVMEKMQEVCFEILFVDDGSVDQTLIKLRKLAERDPRCRYLSFPEISERRRLFIPAFPMPPEII